MVEEWVDGRTAVEKLQGERGDSSGRQPQQPRTPRGRKGAPQRAQRRATTNARIRAPRVWGLG
eukprot:356709-Alexandrium_andersonii.AAC.1